MSNNKEQNINKTNNTNNITDTVFFINESYDKLSYFDLYGNSVLMFIFITLFVFGVFVYCKVMQNTKPIADDWENQRCKPQNILFAGLITHPEGSSAFQYTSDNFQYCVQNILTNIVGYSLEPFQYMINSLIQIFGHFSISIQQIRILINKIRNNFRIFTEDVLTKLLNVIIPMQKMFITLMDVFQKIQGTMTASLYTMLGSYYTLQALMAAILDFIIKVLAALSIIIVGLWVTPFTTPAAASMSAVFLSISTPLAVIIYFMKRVLHIEPNSEIPKLRCFDEYTLITLENKDKIYIKDIKVGDKLFNGSYVTAKIKVTSENLKIYRLNNIIVSESHLVNYENKWIRICEHPNAEQIDYHKPFLYCLNTSNKLIELNGYKFSDWDEIIDDKFEILKNKNNNINFLENIHEFLDDGFEENTIINLHKNKSQKKIKEIIIGDILENGSIVYGIVELEANNITKYIKQANNNNKLYHLLTTNGMFTVYDNMNSTIINDYNHLIDKFII